MWVFGYGSLMWDRWEVSRGCTRRTQGDLAGFRRAFNKASVRNWGTKENPCPTLNLVPSAPDRCRGIAFEFADDGVDKIRAYLSEREGKAFTLRTLPIQLDDGTFVDALVPIYEGRNLIVATKPREIGRMIASAKGADGTGVEYFGGIVRELAKEGIDDPVVTALAEHIAER